MFFIYHHAFGICDIYISHDCWELVTFRSLARNEEYIISVWSAHTKVRCVQCAQYSAVCTVLTLQCGVCSTHTTVRCVQCAHYSAVCAVRTVQCGVCSAHSTVCVQCVHYSVCAVRTLQCGVCSAHTTVRCVQCAHYSAVCAVRCQHVKWKVSSSVDKKWRLRPRNSITSSWGVHLMNM